MNAAASDIRGHLARALRERALAHALLLVANRIEDGVELAEWLCGMLLCSAGDADQPCGRCGGCKLFSAGSHPDVSRLLAKSGHASIAVAQIRELNAFVYGSANQGGAKALCLVPAEAMNLHAANALLKMLEEPPGSVWFILISRHPSLLPATVRSRCMRIAVPAGTAEAPRDEQSAEFLAGWRECRAGRTSPVELAGAWRSKPLGETLEWLIGQLADAARDAVSAGQSPLMALSAYERALSTLGALRRGSPLNALLSIEAILFLYLGEQPTGRGGPTGRNAGRGGPRGGQGGGQGGGGRRS